MVKQHVARTYRDGPDGNTPIFAAGLNDDQDTLRVLSVAVDDLEDAVNGSGAASIILRYFSGTTAERGAVTPSVGTVYLNTTTKKAEYGWGTEWRLADGTLAAGTGGGGTGGTTNAPTNAVAVVNSDNSIDVSATPVTAGTTRTYSLYELRQDTPLVTGLTTPSSHRTPGGTGTYGYWWVAVVDGVASAASNIAYCSLPYGTSPTTGGGSTGGGQIDTPSEILRLGDEGGHWSLDVGYPTGNTSKDMDLIEDGWSDTPYFIPVESNTGVQLRVPMNGGTTPNSDYPRVELRQRNADGSKASWSRSGTNTLAGTTKVTHFPPNKPEVCVAQIHDADDDRLQIRVEDDQWILSVKVGDTNVESTLLTGYTLGTYVAWSIRVSAGRVTVKVNGSTKYDQTPSGWPSSGLYFKTGCYAQTNTSKGNSSSEYLSVVMQKDSLVLTQS